MSGVVARVTFDGIPVDPRSIHTMADAAPYRSLDGFATWTSAQAVLGYQHRSTLLTDADLGYGPATSGPVVCVADARLDNRAVLEAALDEPDSRGSTDSALIAAAYRRWGVAGLARLIGDFAGIIWDAEAEALICFRDPMGMRLLSYHHVKGRSIAAATEIQQLLTVPGVPVRLNELAVIDELVANFGPPEQTFYEDIHHVTPGQAVVSDRTGLRFERLWSPHASHRVLVRRDDAAEMVRERFVDAVAARLRTTRRAGILLSGGVDSGSVAGTAGWLRGRSQAPELVAFCWAFDRFPEADERDVSRLITGPYGMEQVDVDVDDAGPLAELDRRFPHRDDPRLGSFQSAIERGLEVAAALGVRVLLGGDRGDLVFGNTGWTFVDLAAARRWRPFFSELHEHHRWTDSSVTDVLMSNLVRPAVFRASRRSLAGWVRWALRDRRRREWASVPWLRIPHQRLPRRAAADPAAFGFSRARRVDWIFTPLHMRGMAWSERTYARHGVTFADPFSDRRLVELAIALPQGVINQPTDLAKPLMRAAMRGIVPEPARPRLAKVAPTPLFEHGLRNEATEIVRELTLKPRIASEGWVDAQAFRDHYEAWRAGRGELRGEWWWALGVEIWLRRYW